MSLELKQIQSIIDAKWLCKNHPTKPAIAESDSLREFMHAEEGSRGGN